ncbi:MAG TPA: sigma-70 family RNA polymerase sigma factor [Acidobacteriaceae bacterium]|jgi:RNA polymerase sigma-70 factor (ECF subfamily)|nr:sigma-70 family RNA polymerase sigma factor [Acidobacteriaceae bacterium]
MGTMAAEIAEAQDTGTISPADALDEMTTLISERLPYFHGIALRRVKNVADAEDAVQNAFLSAWKHLDKFQGRARMSTWLTAIVINSARMVMRKRSRASYLPLEGQDQEDENLQLLDMLADAGPDPETQVRRREFEHRLRRLSVHLSPNLREVIRLRGIEGLSVRETADALGLTESAVKTRDARARQELRRLDQINPAAIVAPGRSRRPRRRRRRLPAE